ncbi:J domain-containing protein [Bartonella sp. DGB1]|uniref:J domain-containing protein n=1 Tax=Bartonella sp. DGB1 TaxID=3239807 RepID=UPI0035256EE0
MKFSSKYFDSIKIGANKKNKAEISGKQICQWEGCTQEAPCKAPMGRANEGKYIYFCLEHVREYNKNFNYFSGLSQAEISKYQRDETVGHRPTWSSDEKILKAGTAQDFSRIPSGSASYQNKIRQIMGIKGKVGVSNIVARKLKPLEKKAFNTLQLDINASSDQIKVKYKELVKKYHPDTNGGDRSTEQLFVDVMAAYKVLQKAGIIK